MHKLASTQFCFVLAALAALTSVACGGGDDDNGGGGGAGAGGTGGGGAVGNSLLITDFETGKFDGYAEDMDKGWKIAWFTYGDPTVGASITPPLMSAFASVTDAGRPAGQQHVGNMKGMGFGTWGAGMGFNFKANEVPTPPGYTDISGYKGVSFWAKVNNATSGIVQIKVVDVAHAESKDGGTCVPGTLPCSNTYTSMKTVPTSWAKYDLVWADFTQAEWGQKFDRDLTKVIGFQFQVDKNALFDVSVDDFMLVPN